MNLTEQQIKTHLLFKEKLNSAKKLELISRNELCDSLFCDRVGEFSVNGEAGNYKYNASSKMTRSYDIEIFNDIYGSGEITEEAAECFELVPKFSKAKLDKLDEDDPLWQCITEKQAQSTLTITEKKDD